MYAIKALFNQFSRFILTAFGISLCLILMLFLLSLYHGVSDSSVRYVRDSDADIWVLQRHAANIMRGTSILTYRYGNMIRNVKGVKSIAPILFFTATLNVPNNTASVHLAGFDPSTGKGGPPMIVKGKNVTKDDQIVLDEAFAAKYKIHIGDKIPVRDDTLTVTGLSGGTNMYVIQFAFITLNKAQELLGFPGIASCYQVFLEPGANPVSVAKAIRSTSRNIAVFDKETFLRNNIHEAETGVLPMLYVIAFIAAIVLTAILSLILSVYVLEQQKDYTIMKALGAPRGYIPGIILQQSFLLSGSGMIIAAVFINAVLKLVEILSPTITSEFSMNDLLIVAAGLIAISLISSVFPWLRQKNIYPLDAFK